jgi:secretion/DNA translocation related TadE-like protein
MPRPTEAGVATVTAAALAGGVLLVAAVLLQVGLVIAAKHRAQAAADLAAVAGSAATLRGADGCEVARGVARRNAAVLVACRTDLAVVTLRTEVASPTLVWGGRFRTTADARAAPDFYVAPSR